MAAQVQIRPIPDEAVRQNARLGARLSPSARAKVESAAATLALATRQQPTMTAAQLQAKARAAVVQRFPTLAGADIDSVVFLVMMQCSKDQQSDLQQMMNSMKQTTAEKQAARNANSTDQLDDLGQEQQLRLQTLEDQRSKVIEALSNIMKSLSNTRSSITDNLK